MGVGEEFRIVVCEQGDYNLHVTGIRFHILKA